MKPCIERLKEYYLKSCDPNLNLVDEAIASIEQILDNKSEDEIYHRQRPLIIAYLALMQIKKKTRSIRIKRFVDNDSVKTVRDDLFPDYVEYAKKDMAREIGAFLLEENLLKEEYTEGLLGKQLELSCTVVEPRKEKTE